MSFEGDRQNTNFYLNILRATYQEITHHQNLLSAIFAIFFLRFRRVPSTQQSSPYNTSNQDNVQLVPNWNKLEIQQLHWDPLH